MAKISELPRATGVNGQELFPVVIVNDDGTKQNMVMSAEDLAFALRTLEQLVTTDVVDSMIQQVINENGYVTLGDLVVQLASKAEAIHEHMEYSQSGHTHSVSDIVDMPSMSDYATGQQLTDVANVVGQMDAEVKTNTLNIQTILAYLDSIVVGGEGSETESGHTHSNFSVLETITLSKIIEWDSKSSNDLTVNLEKYQHLVIDGDWSDALQMFFDDPSTMGYIRFPQDKEFFVTKPITLKRNNLTIDLNGCTFKWGNQNLFEQALERNVGVFQFEGTTIADFGNITEFSNHTDMLVHGGRMVSVIECQTTSGLQVNDFVKVYVRTSDTQSIDRLTPFVIVLTKVLKIEGNKVWIEYQTPYDFGTDYTFTQFRKFQPIQNVTIKNGFFQDINNWDYRIESQSEIPTDVLKRCVCFINATGVSNCKFENIHAVNTTNPVVKVSLGYDVTVDNLSLDRPAITCGGKGYGVQFENVLYGKVSNIYGNYVRHCVDFSGCYFSEMKKIRGRYTFGSSFMTHGCYDHDLLFEDCQGSMSLGAGLDYGKSSINVTVRNCIINQLGHSYSYGLTVENSDIVIVPTDFSKETELWQQATFINSKVKLLGGYYGASTRYNGYESSLNFLNCTVELLNVGKDTSQTFRGFNRIQFDGGVLINKHNKDNLTNLTVNIGGVNQFNLNNLTLDSVYFELSSSTSTSFNVYNVKANVSLATSDVFALFNIQSGTEYNIMTINGVQCTNRVGTLRFVRVGGTTQNQEDIIITNCILDGVKLYLNSTDNSSLIGNIFHNVTCEGFTQTNFPSNVWR